MRFFFGITPSLFLLQRIIQSIPNKTTQMKIIEIPGLVSLTWQDENDQYYFSNPLEHHSSRNLSQKSRFIAQEDMNLSKFQSKTKNFPGTSSYLQDFRYKIILVIETKLPLKKLFEYVAQIEKYFIMKIVLVGLFMAPKKNQSLMNKIEEFRKTKWKYFAGQYDRVNLILLITEQDADPQMTINNLFETQKIPVSQIETFQRNHVTDALTYKNGVCSPDYCFSVIVLNEFTKNNFGLVMVHEILHGMGVEHGDGLMKEIHDESHLHFENEAKNIGKQMFEYWEPNCFTI